MISTPPSNLPTTGMQVSVQSYPNCRWANQNQSLPTSFNKKAESQKTSPGSQIIKYLGDLQGFCYLSVGLAFIGVTLHWTIMKLLNKEEQAVNPLLFLRKAF